MFKAIITECRALCEGRTKEQQKAGLEASWARRPYAATQRHGDNPDTATKRQVTRIDRDNISHKVSLKKRIDADPQGTHDREGYKYPAEANKIHKLPYAQKRLSDYEAPGKLPTATALPKRKPGLLSKLASKFKK
jgi:hypothetical protein